MSSSVTRIPHGTEELRQDIHAVLARYPELTVSEVVGALEIIKMDVVAWLKEAE